MHIVQRICFKIRKETFRGGKIAKIWDDIYFGRFSRTTTIRTIFNAVSVWCHRVTRSFPRHFPRVPLEQQNKHTRARDVHSTLIHYLSIISREFESRRLYNNSNNGNRKWWIPTWPKVTYSFWGTDGDNDAICPALLRTFCRTYANTKVIS